MLKFKLIIIKILNIIAAFLDRFRLGRVFLYEVINYMMNKEKKIIHNDVSIVSSITNRMVLCLKAWESRTLPGLLNVKKSHFTLNY